MSRQLALWVFLVHGVAAASLVPGALPLPLPLLAALQVAVAASLYHTLFGRVLGRSPRALLGAVWESDGAWTVVDAGGNRHEAWLLDSSYVHPRLLILNFRLAGGVRTMVLLPDSLPPSVFRRLLVRLRLSRSGGGPRS